MPIESLTRNISGKGIIQIPEEFQNAREIILYAQVLRESSSVYRNYRVNPPESFFANITFCRDEFVLQRYVMDFDSQMYLVHSSQSAQNLLAQICALDNVLDSFVNFAIALGFAYTKNNSITNFPYDTFLPNLIRFVCYGSTAVRLTLSADELARCKPGDGEPSPPPPPPPPQEKVPPGTPVLVDPPYEGEDDGGDTVPDPIDEEEDDGLPFGEECLRYVVAVRLFDTTQTPPEGTVVSLEVWGVIQSFSLDPDPFFPETVLRANLVCGDQTSTTCTQGQTVAYASGNISDGFFAEIESITPVL
jgi:hypothetical protein